MIEPSQCRAARALLEWTQPDLAQATGLSVVTVRAFEKGGEMRDSNRNLVRLTLERAGVEFIPENGGGPGVRLRKAGKHATDHPKPVGPATDAVDAMDQAITKDRAGGKRLASVKETGEEVPPEQWERFEAVDKKPRKR